MKRLTYKIDDGEEVRYIPHPDNSKGHQECMNKLGELENAEENGMLVRLPCAPCETIYRICPLGWAVKMGQMWNGKIVTKDCQRCPYESCDCHDIGYIKGAQNIVREVTAGDELWILKRKPYFGKIYFLTREAAEAALKEKECDG